MGNSFCKQTSTPATSDLSKAIEPTGTNFLRWEQAGRCRSAPAKIYSTSNKGTYPHATQAQFIPNPLNSRFITSVQARAMAAKAQSKHKAFIKKTSTDVGYNIIGLDYYIEDYQVTLRQAIMSIRSASESDFKSLHGCQ